MSFLNNLEILHKLSNFVQITVLVLIFLSAFLQVSKFILDKRIKSLKETQIQERFLSIENRPDFDQNMWEMVTGIPASIFRDYHAAFDLYDSKDYTNCSKTVQLAIDAYEKKKSWNLKGYDLKQHKEKLGEIYTLAVKANTRIKRHDISYEYAQKAIYENPTHFTYYSAAVTAYNLKKYQEALDHINKAIELKPVDSEPDTKIYEEIIQKCLDHLKEDNK